MADLTSAGTGAGGLGTPEARWSFIFLLCCGVAGIALGGQWAQAPLLWTLAGLAALAASLLLTTPVRHPLPPSRVVWIPPRPSPCTRRSLTTTSRCSASRRTWSRS
jgi:hypothetical protein